MVGGYWGGFELTDSKSGAQVWGCERFSGTTTIYSDLKLIVIPFRILIPALALAQLLQSPLIYSAAGFEALIGDFHGAVVRLNAAKYSHLSNVPFNGEKIKFAHAKEITVRAIHVRQVFFCVDRYI